MEESKIKKEGAYMTPAEIVDKMINFGDLDYTKNILEPTAGDGNIVMKVIEKKISLGMTPQQAIDSTYGNELFKERYDDMIKRLKEFCINNNCNFPESNFTNEDILKKEINIENYEIITNLPFGCWTNSNLPRQIINKFIDTKAIYLTKWSTGCNKKYVQHVKKIRERRISWNRIRHVIMGIRSGIHGRRYLDILAASEITKAQAEKRLERNFKGAQYRRLWRRKCI